MTRYGVFPGMTESIGPMAGENHLYPGAERRLPLVGARAPVKGRDGSNAPYSSSAMSSGPAIPRSGYSPAEPVSASPDSSEHKTLDTSEGRNYHRMAPASFSPCLSPGGHPIVCVHVRLSAAKIPQ